MEKKRNESLTFKILSRDEDIKKIKDSNNTQLHRQINELKRELERVENDYE